MIWEVVITALAFGLVWLGSGWVIKSVSRFSHQMGSSPFAVSFIFLGLLTSAPEFALGLSAVATSQPQIFAGNLLGGTVVIFLLVIPLLAVGSGRIRLTHQLDKSTLLSSLAVIIAPAILILDGQLTQAEGLSLIGLYLLLFVQIQKQRAFLDAKHTYSSYDIIKLVSGLAIVLSASKVIVTQTLYFSRALSFSPFYISLIGLSLGTNMPELSLAVRSIFSGKKEVAMGDYLGSAAANTLLFGIFTLISSGHVSIGNGLFKTLAFVAVSLCVFYLFAKSQNTISRLEGAVMLTLYAAFVAAQLL